MIQPREDRTPPMTPQLALRVAIIGGCALAVFAVIFFRLWVLQVLTGSQYVQQAQANDTEQIAVAAPRGEILDSSGTVMVSSNPVPSIQISGEDLPVPVTDTQADLSTPPATDMALYNRLAKVLQISTKPAKCSYELWIGPHEYVQNVRLAKIPCLVAQGISQAPYANVTIKTDVSLDVQAYIAERQTGAHAFKGVVSEEIYERKYPLGDTAAQLFGTIGPISKQEYGTKPFKGISDTSTVGQSGLEYQYNQYLMGTNGYEKAKVNADGEFEGWEKGKAPTAGDNLQLSINLKVQQVGERSLAESIEKSGADDGGAFVAMNPDNGQVYAMGSNPTFNPSIFTHPITQKQYDQDFGASSNYPLLNRAIQSVGPDGSTFKVITATAALESGVWGVDQIYDDYKNFCFPGTTECLQNSGGAHYGPVDVTSAIKYSDDVFFYNLGYLMNNPAPQGGALQKWAKAYGIGQRTGIDLPDEASGTLPSPGWVSAQNKLEEECETATGPYKGKPKHPSGCGIANGDPWTVGDNVNTAVGQGDVQVTPLQLAVVYSAIANDGTIVTPHVGEDIQSPDGQVISKIDPGPKRKLNINPTYLGAIQEGLRQAASVPNEGTSADVMGNFPEQVYGKTGTAQYFNAENVETDYAWYACYVPKTATSKPIVVVVWVPKGGFGDAAAAPVARQILSQWFLGKPGPFISGVNPDA